MRTQNKVVAKGNNNAGRYDRSEKRTRDEPFRCPSAVSWSSPRFPSAITRKVLCQSYEIMLYKRAVAESLSRSQENSSSAEMSNNSYEQPQTTSPSIQTTGQGPPTPSAGSGCVNGAINSSLYRPGFHVRFCVASKTLLISSM
jgi:hypothetical protein